MTVLQIETAEVFLPLLEPVRWKGAKGGRASAKSHFFADNLIDRCMTNMGTRWICVREHQVSLKHSVKQLLEDKIKLWRLRHYFDCKKTHIETPGGGIINFIGMKNHTASGAKSMEGYHGAWVEEAQTLSQASFDMLYPTIRTPGSEIWCSWNPDQPTDPVDKFFRENAGRPDLACVTSTYRDNPWLPDVSRNDIQYDMRRDIDRYKHIWLGEYNRKSSRRVFKNWRIDAIPEIVSSDVLLWGADWGYADDPSVLVGFFIRGKTLYIFAEAYRVRCEIDDTPALFDGAWDGHPGAAREWPITADSARPEIIAWMKRNGYPRIRASMKGKDSVMEGVKFLQGYDIVVDPACLHTIDELASYSWKVDPLTDDVLPVLEESKNHVIDALRYGAERTRRAKIGLIGA